MKPAAFVYHRPHSLTEVFELLDTHMDDAKIIAGGQSLVPMMNMRLVRPQHLIDINEVPEMNEIELLDNTIKIGALTRQIEIENSQIIQQNSPIISYATKKIGHYAIRQRGTIGGSLVHADPSAELPLMAALFNSDIALVSSDETRVVSAREFFLTIYTTDIMPNEMLSHIEFPLMRADEGWSYVEFSRKTGDFAIVSVGNTLQLDQDGSVSHIRLALGGIESIPFNASDLVEGFIGEQPNEAWIEALAHEVVSQTEPQSDIHASAEDRSELLSMLIKKALNESISRVRKGGIDDGPNWHQASN